MRNKHLVFQKNYEVYSCIFFQTFIKLITMKYRNMNKIIYKQPALSLRIGMDPNDKKNHNVRMVQLSIHKKQLSTLWENVDMRIKYENYRNGKSNDGLELKINKDRPDSRKQICCWWRLQCKTSTRKNFSNP